MESDTERQTDRRPGNVTYEIKDAAITYSFSGRANFHRGRRIRAFNVPRSGRQKVVNLVIREILSDSHDALETYNNEDIRRLAQAMTSVLPTKQQAELDMAKKAGPFYQTATVVDWLGISRQALNKRAAKGELLAVQDAEKRIYYPSRQFMSDGTVVPGLRPVLDALAKGTPVKWTWALWLGGTNRALNGETPWEALHNGEVDEVLTAASRHAARLAE